MIEPLALQLQRARRATWLATAEQRQAPANAPLEALQSLLAVDVQNRVGKPTCSSTVAGSLQFTGRQQQGCLLQTDARDADKAYKPVSSKGGTLDLTWPPQGLLHW